MRSLSEGVAVGGLPGHKEEQVKDLKGGNTCQTLGYTLESPGVWSHTAWLVREKQECEMFSPHAFCSWTLGGLEMLK